MKIMAWMMMVICCALAFTPVSAQQRDRGGQGGGWHGQRHGQSSGERPHYNRPQAAPQGSWWHAPLGSAAGGAVGSFAGNWLWKQWAQPEPPQEAPVRTVGWCLDRYRSYDPYTRTYLGFDGFRHSCP